LEGRPTRHDSIAARSLRSDRLAQAQVWLGRITPVRRAVLTRLAAFAELDAALRRADAGLNALGRTVPHREPRAMEAAAQDLLAGRHLLSSDAGWALHAAAGLHEAALLLRSHKRALRRYGVIAL
jgi:hypothetical protein